MPTSPFSAWPFTVPTLIKPILRPIPTAATATATATTSSVRPYTQPSQSYPVFTQQYNPYQNYTPLPLSTPPATANNNQIPFYYAPTNNNNNLPIYRNTFTIPSPINYLPLPSMSTYANASTSSNSNNNSPILFLLLFQLLKQAQNNNTTLENPIPPSTPTTLDKNNIDKLIELFKKLKTNAPVFNITINHKDINATGANFGTQEDNDTTTANTATTTPDTSAVETTPSTPTTPLAKKRLRLQQARARRLKLKQNFKKNHKVGHKI